MSEEDAGLPEEAAGKLEQSNAVPVNEKGPWRRPDLPTRTRQIFQNLDDMFDYGEEIIMKSPRSYQIVVVIENEGWSDLLYPNQPHYWVGERFAVDPMILLDNPDATPDIDFTPLYEKMVEWKEQGIKEGIKPRGNVQVSTYQGVPVYLPDPLLDYSRPEEITEATTGATTGTTVETTTIVKPNVVGGVTTSTTTPGTVGTPTSRFDSKGATPTTSSVSSRFDSKGATPAYSNPDATDPRGADQRNTPSATVAGGRGNGAAEVAQRRANSVVASGTANDVQTGTAPCLPNNAPSSTGTSGSGATPPASVPYQDAIMRQARAAAAAPESTNPDATDPRGADQRNTPSTTTPTTVTQPPSTPTSSATPAARPPNVYIYEPITPGFDRYDFNSGKKVYTPNNGPSRNASGQTSVPNSTPTNTSAADTTAAQSAVAAGYGSSQYGEFGPPVTARDPNLTGPF